MLQFRYLIILFSGFFLMNSQLSFLNSVLSDASVCNIRYPILLEGSKAWYGDLLSSFLSQDNTSSLLTEIYGDISILDIPSFAIKKALKKLGQESQCLIINISDEFNANAINAICGTLVGGGLVFFVKDKNSQLPSTLIQWISGFKTEMICLSEELSIPQYERPENGSTVFTSEVYASNDQDVAVSAIKKVVTGHAKRPLIITADRGRGKSSAIGIAIAELVLSHKLTIAITAPQRASVDEIFSHAARVSIQLGMPVEHNKNTLIINGSSILYIAPDELVRGEHLVDVVCVDEAAAIPAPMLLSLSEKYSRMIFSTTINGYEGTGRGFEIKFKQSLAKIRPNYRTLEMIKPIRWNDNDPLELWLSHVFLLNHATSVDIESESFSISSRDIYFRRVNTDELLSSASLSQSLFSLLVSAHYQTSPNDWISLLTDTSLECWVGIDKKTKALIACTLISIEGNLDNDLISAIQCGTRRPKGHLVPVSLTQILCIDEPAIQHCARIMRIAIAVDYQGRGIGSEFIHTLSEYYADEGMDYLGTSFGSTFELNLFWSQLGFGFVRLGITKDKASGTHSLLAIKPLSLKSLEWNQIAVEYFHTSFPEQLMSVFSHLGMNESKGLLSSCITSNRLTPIMLKRVSVYTKGGLGVEVIGYELRMFVLSNILLLDSLSLIQQQLVITKLLQLNEWSEVIKITGLSGRREAELVLRESIQSILINLQCKSS
ncbi:tRNA(Met) cytidine acetyltransferase [Aliivibrio salmonicida]|uniref:tRNA(Met) cytidine acetyltransferase TmcA n=2 Tax=Aliivibrio salmonicida TaxID=40269 RepID=B6EPZ0_ALISL|nr:tRNA(Met) cytidine acetyltransferase [Aliivibrio salmonicida]CAQ81856.1 putative exported ATPase protein [Aliivibrio salmonicida LFI1238]